MSESTTLALTPRTPGGTPVARALRRQNLVPGILYGRGNEPYPFSVDVPSLRLALTGPAGRHAVVALKVEGRSAPVHAVLKEFQLDPVRDRVTHVDFLEISMTEEITAPVAVHLTGEALGLREGGILDQGAHEIEVRALPANLPNEIVVDVSPLHVGESLRLSDIPTIANVEWASDLDTVLATIAQPTTMEQIEAEQAAEAEAAGEGVAPAETEEPAAEEADE